MKPVDKTIALSSEYDKYVWRTLDELQRNGLTKSTLHNLQLQPLPFATGKEPTLFRRNDDTNTTSISAIIYSDGGSRGNPGPSAAGFVIMNEMGNVLAARGAFLGVPINNRIRELAVQFDRITFTHVLRQYNKLADGAVNKILDQRQE